jgi:hypothetical protein
MLLLFADHIDQDIQHMHKAIVLVLRMWDKQEQRDAGLRLLHRFYLTGGHRPIPSTFRSYQER